MKILDFCDGWSLHANPWVHQPTWWVIRRATWAVCFSIWFYDRRFRFTSFNSLSLCKYVCISTMLYIYFVGKRNLGHCFALYWPDRIRTTHYSLNSAFFDSIVHWADSSLYHQLQSFHFCWCCPSPLLSMDCLPRVFLRSTGSHLFRLSYSSSFPHFLHSQLL